MPANRTSVLLSIFKGFLVAAAITLIGMVLIAALAVGVSISDQTLSLLNQFLKIIAILAGTFIAVGRGGSRGFVTGVVLALVYMIAGYVLYVVLGGGAWSITGMLGEMLLGAAIGGVCGAILANLPPRRRRRKA